MSGRSPWTRLSAPECGSRSARSWVEIEDSGVAIDWVSRSILRIEGGSMYSQTYDRRSIQELTGIIDSQRMEARWSSDRRFIQELTGIIDSQRMEIEQSRRDQLLVQEEMSEQNRALRETCIRNMRDMEEWQKSHVLKVEELSRGKMTEDFEAVTSFFQGSNVKTVDNFGDNDAKYPDAWIDDVHTRNSLASPLYLQEREASASLLQAFHSQRESLFQRAQSILASTKNPLLDVTKSANLTVS